jgi:hypothetical protein
MQGVQSLAAGGVTVRTSLIVQNQNSQQQTYGDNDAIFRV